MADYMLLKAVDQVEETLDIYRCQAGVMSRKQLRDEEHDSACLGAFMELNGKPHPGGNCDAHAIVSGGHPGATPIRAVLVQVKIRIDDVRNGTWLPRRSADTPHPKMPMAVPHRKGYYKWLGFEFDTLDIESMTELDVERLLRGIEYDLKFSCFPDYVMLSADQLKKEHGA